MEIFGVTLNGLKAISQIESLFKVGEAVNVNLVSEKSDNRYIVNLKGILFEAHSNEQLRAATLTMVVENIKPAVELKTPDGSISLTLTQIISAAKTAKESNKTTEYGKIAQIFKPLKESSITELLDVLKQGEIVQATIVKRNSNNRLVLNIKGVLFEAVSTAQISPEKRKINLIVEKIRPALILKLLEGSENPVEYVQSKLSIKIEKPLRMQLEQLFNNLKQAIQQGDRVRIATTAAKLNSLIEALINAAAKAKEETDSLLSVLTKETGQFSPSAKSRAVTSKDNFARSNSLPNRHPSEQTAVQHANRGSKGISENRQINLAPQRATSSNGSKQTENITSVTDRTSRPEAYKHKGSPAYPPEENKNPPQENRQIRQDARVTKQNGSVEKRTLTPKETTPKENEVHVSQSITNETKVQNVTGKEQPLIQMGSDKTIQSKLKTLLSHIAQLPNVLPQQNQINVFGLAGWLKELSEGLDKLIKNATRVRSHISNIEALSIKGNEKLSPGTLPQLEQFMMHLIEQKTPAEKGDIATKSVEFVRDTLKLAKTLQPQSNLFVQIPVFIDDKRLEIYVSTNEERGKDNKRKSYRINLLSELPGQGMVKIDALYMDGNIHCNVGFEKKHLLQRFNEKIPEIKEAVGPNVTIDTYMMKTKPVIARKVLNIKV